MTLVADMHRPHNFIVAQIGARMHYAVPRILHEAGMLAHLYTDNCASKGWPRLLHDVPAPWRPAALRRLLSRARAAFQWDNSRRLRGSEIAL